MSGVEQAEKSRGASADDEALITFLGSLMGHLREIKQIEMQWIGVYSILTVPAAGYLSVNDMSATPGLIWVLSGWALGYLLLTGWIQGALCKERLSYYSVMLTVIRLENHLSFFSKRVLPKAMAFAAFPEGVGPNEEIRGKDGTQRHSSFRTRIGYTLFIYFALLAGTVYQVWSVHRAGSAGQPISSSCAAAYTLYALALLGLDFLYLRWAYKNDLCKLTEGATAARNERLLGADETLYGNEK